MNAGLKHSLFRILTQGLLASVIYWPGTSLMMLKTAVLTELRNLEQFVKLNCYM